MCNRQVPSHVKINNVDLKLDIGARLTPERGTSTHALPFDGRNGDGDMLAPTVVRPGCEGVRCWLKE